VDKLLLLDLMSIGTHTHTHTHAHTHTHTHIHTHSHTHRHTLTHTHTHRHTHNTHTLLREEEIKQPASKADLQSRGIWIDSCGRRKQRAR